MPFWLSTLAPYSGSEGSRSSGQALALHYMQAGSWPKYATEKRRLTLHKIATAARIRRFLGSLTSGPIARGTIRTSMVLGLRLLVQAGTLLLIARLLGPAQFGIFAGIAAMAVLLGSFSTFGTHLVLLAEVAKNPSRRDAVLSYAVPTTLLCSSLLFAIFLLLTQFWFSTATIPPWAIACIGLTEILLLPLYTLPATEELALEKTARSQLLMLLPLGLRTLSAAFVILLAPQQPMEAFLALYAVSAASALIIMWCYKRQAWPSPRSWRMASVRQLKYSAGYATLALTALGPSELDKILAAKLLPAGVAGAYTAVARVIGASTLPVTALLLSAMPRLFRHSTAAPVRAQRLNHWIFVTSLLYGGVLAGILWLTAPVVQWLFGSAYSDLAHLLHWLCWVIPGLALRIAAGSILMTLERPWLRAAFETFGMATLIIAALALCPRFGVHGMVTALAVSEWGMAILGLAVIVHISTGYDTPNQSVPR